MKYPTESLVAQHKQQLTISHQQHNTHTKFSLQNTNTFDDDFKAELAMAIEH